MFKKNINTQQDLVVIGGGTSGVMCALGAIKYGLKVTLICSKADFAQSSLLAEVLPSKTFSHVAQIVNTIKQARHFGLDPHLGTVNISKINNYICNILRELQQENDFDIFEKLGGNLIIGLARFINNKTIIVGNIRINSKYFVIATGTRDAASNILDIQETTVLRYREIFNKANIAKNTIILGSRAESLEMAQALTRFGSQVTLICSKSKLLPLEDPELVKKLRNSLEQEGIIFYLSTKVLQFYRQNQRKLLVCQDQYGDKFAIEGEEIIDMRDPCPNIEELSLQNIDLQYSDEGILVNHRMQTTEKNIFAIGSVAKTPFKSVHLVEQEVNVILSNIIFKVARSINYNLIPRALFTDPQLAAVGLYTDSNVNNNNIKSLRFDFNKIDAALYQRLNYGEIKLICNGDKLLSATILGPFAADIIREYSIAMQLGIGVSDIANTMHVYPTLSCINKRVAHKIFDKTLLPSNATLTFERAIYKMQQLVRGLSFS